MLHWLWSFKHGGHNIIVGLVGLHNPVPMQEVFAWNWNRYGVETMRYMKGSLKEELNKLSEIFPTVDFSCFVLIHLKNKLLKHIFNFVVFLTFFN